jgi:lipoprotein-releasing system permease protein
LINCLPKSKIINFPYYIAKRYFSSKKKNVVHLITQISVIGIAVTTAALIVLISAFNGIEMMVENLYSEFDANIIITSSKGKTFKDNQIILDKIKNEPSITYYSKAVEEIVILKHEKKWINAKLIGVNESYLELANVKQHMVDGAAFISRNGEPFGLVGATLLDRLQGFIPEKDGEFEVVTSYFPKRDANVGKLSNPFKTELLKISGRISYNKDVNEEIIIVPIDFAQKMLNYQNEISAIYVNFSPDINLEDSKRNLQNKLGKDFEVKTYIEKNKLIYQTSKSEKMIVIFILIFVFILAVFNLVASLTMMFIEKKEHLKTMESFGFDGGMIFKTFLYQGIFISMKGISIGLLLGFGIVSLQYFGELIILPNSNNQAFPVKISFSDSVFVFVLVTIISILASYFTVLFLTNNYKKKLS